MQKITDIWSVFFNTQFIKSIAIILIGIIGYKIIIYFMNKSKSKTKIFLSNKGKTYFKLIKSILRYIFIVAVVILLLQENGIDLSSVLAGVGILGVIFTKFIYPMYLSIIDKLSDKAIIIISIVVFIFTIIDIFVSFNAMSKIKSIVGKEIENLKNKDATDDVKKIVKRKIPGVNFLHERLIDTYHLLDKEYIKRTIKKVNEKTKSGYGLFILFLIIGLIIGLLLSNVFKLGSYKIIIPFSLSVSSLIAAIILKVGDK